MIRSGILLFIVTGFAMSVSADDKSDKAIKDLQGEWKVEKAVAEGKEVPAEKTKRLSFTIKDDQLIPNDNPKDVASFKLDLTQKPAWFDITDRSKETMLGIYELSDDTLKICLANPGFDRPKEFSSAKDGKTNYMILKKACK